MPPPPKSTKSKLGPKKSQALYKIFNIGPQQCILILALSSPFKNIKLIEFTFSKRNLGYSKEEKNSKKKKKHVY